MNDFGYSKAQQQYDSKLPERYNRKPACYCSNCGEEMYLFDRGFKLDNKIYCDYCAEEITITEEEFY